MNRASLVIESPRFVAKVNHRSGPAPISSQAPSRAMRSVAPLIRGHSRHGVWNGPGSSPGQARDWAEKLQFRGQTATVRSRKPLRYPRPFYPGSLAARRLNAATRHDRCCERVMFAFFEQQLQPTTPPRHPEPPPGLIAFYWHFARQAKGLFAGLFAAGFALALLDSLIPVFMGRIVTLITSNRPETLFATFWPLLAGMALVLLVLRCRTSWPTRRSPPM